MNTMATSSPVGVIGLGRMGSAIATRLLDMDTHLVVWNRTPGKAASLVERGAVQAATPSQVVSECETIIVIVRDDDALSDVYFNPGGILDGDALRGRCIIDMTTATVAATRRAGQAVIDAGGAYLDAPVSGTLTPARNGQLLVMTGGQAEHLDRVRPVLDKLARKVVHAGPLGSGIVMKLVLNLPLASYWQTLGEALALAQAYGLDFDATLKQIADSKAAIGALPSKLDAIAGRAPTVEFDLAGMHKDLLAMRATAAAAGLVLPASSAAADSAGQAVAEGWGARDLAQLVKFVAG
jgi:3-hydroxyisobutyrate dehydrogenase